MRRGLSLNMHIVNVGDHGVAGGEEVAKESARTLIDRWSPAAVSCDGLRGELVNIHGPRPPALSAVSAQPATDGWGDFFLAFNKRLSYNIVADHENISITPSSVMRVWFIHLVLCGLRRKENTDRGRLADTNSLGSVFSLSLCHKGHPGYCRCVWKQLYWSCWALLLYSQALTTSSHPEENYTGTGRAKGHPLMKIESCNCLCISMQCINWLETLSKSHGLTL